MYAQKFILKHVRGGGNTQAIQITCILTKPIKYCSFNQFQFSKGERPHWLSWPAFRSRAAA